MRALLFFITLLSLPLLGRADARLYIAVASNFEPAARALVADFEAEHQGVSVSLSSAASGTHFHQIKHGAPFAIFFSADQHYPSQLRKDPRLGEIYTYARGQLVLASRSAFEYNSAIDAITEGSARLAIANPNTAPYGRAAAEVLATHSFKGPLIQGQSVGQTLGFLMSGAVDFAFIARSQLLTQPDIFWQRVPDTYSAIDQDAILLKPEDKLAQAFWSYLQSHAAQAIIQTFGYEVVMND